MKSSSLFLFIGLNEDAISNIHILSLIFNRSQYFQCFIHLHLLLLVDLIGLFVEDAILEELNPNEVVHWC